MLEIVEQVKKTMWSIIMQSPVWNNRYIGGRRMNIIVKDPNTIAKYMLSERPMSQKKLHKLLYFSFVLYLTENNESEEEIDNLMFSNSFQAWVHGPVLRELYPKYARFSYKDMYIEEFDEEIPANAKEIVDEILNLFGDLSANKLETMSHEDLAWQRKRVGLSSFEPSSETLDLEEMYFSGLQRFYE